MDLLNMPNTEVAHEDGSPETESAVHLVSHLVSEVGVLAGWLGLWGRAREHPEIVARSPTNADGRRVQEAWDQLTRVRQNIEELEQELYELQSKNRSPSARKAFVTTRIEELDSKISEAREREAELKQEFNSRREPFNIERQLMNYSTAEIAIFLLLNYPKQWSYLELAKSLTGEPAPRSDSNARADGEGELLDKARQEETDRAVQATRQWLMRNLPKIATQYGIFEVVKPQYGGDQAKIRATKLLEQMFRETLVPEMERIRKNDPKWRK